MPLPYKGIRHLACKRLTLQQGGNVVLGILRIRRHDGEGLVRLHEAGVEDGYHNLTNISGSFLGISLYEYFHDKSEGRKPIVTAYNFD